MAAADACAASSAPLAFQRLEQDMLGHILMPPEHTAQACAAPMPRMHVALPINAASMLTPGLPAGRVPSQLDMLAARLTTQLLTLGDVAASAGLGGVPNAVAEATEAVVQDDSKRGGFFGPFAALFESILKARS